MGRMRWQRSLSFYCWTSLQLILLLLSSFASRSTLRVDGCGSSLCGRQALCWTASWPEKFSAMTRMRDCQAISIERQRFAGTDEDVERDFVCYWLAGRQQFAMHIVKYMQVDASRLARRGTLAIAFADTSDIAMFMPPLAALCHSLISQRLMKIYIFHDSLSLKEQACMLGFQRSLCRCLCTLSNCVHSTLLKLLSFQDMLVCERGGVEVPRL